MIFEEITAKAIEIAEFEFAKVAKEKDIPGISFGLVFNGDLVYSSGTGETEKGSGQKPSANTVFRIASMTKSFTAQAILLLRDRGLLRLEDDIEIYLPWAHGIGLPEGSQVITIWDLLTMGAGLPTDDPWGDRQEDLPLEQFDHLVGSGLTFNRPVNTGFEYSNLGYALLGRIIGVVSGEEYEVFVQREIIDPYGMKSTTFFTERVSDANRAHGYVNFPSGKEKVPPVQTGAFTPMGGLHSTVGDITRWVAHFQSGQFEAQTPARHIQSALVPAEGEIPARILVSHYGYGIFISDDAELGRFTSHSGGYPGFGSHMRWHKESGWGIVALANLTYAPMSTTSAQVLNQIAWMDKKNSHRGPELHDATRHAIGVVEGLLRQWDDGLADQNFAINMDFDCPRQDRKAEFEKVGTELGELFRLEGSLTSNAKSHVKWKVVGNGKMYQIELIVSPEKSPKVQKVVLKLIEEI
ncbi:MAG: serine hydrolase domain-containing protein [Actinomycetes bacterium]